MLTVKQEKFVLNLINGMSQREAYKASYNAENMSDKSIDNKASKLLKQTEITARYKELLGELQKTMVMSAFEKRAILREIATNSESSYADKIRAIDTDNKMAGEYVTKVDGNFKIDRLEDLL